MSVDVVEYRNGNEREVRASSPASARSPMVTLSRGIVGSLNLYRWMDQVRNGDPAALRTVVIQLQNEDHTAVVMTWSSLRARPVKFTSGPLNGKGTDVAMEELTLAYERLEVKGIPRQGMGMATPRARPGCGSCSRPRRPVRCPRRRDHVHELGDLGRIEGAVRVVARRRADAELEVLGAGTREPDRLNPS